MQNVVLEIRAKLKTETHHTCNTDGAATKLPSEVVKQAAAGIKHTDITDGVGLHKDKRQCKPTLVTELETEVVLIQKTKYTKMIDDPFSFYKLIKRTCTWAVSTIRLLLH